jgi:hypothetical protein
VQDLLDQQECAITSVNLAEIVDVCCRTRGLSPPEVEEALDPLLEGTIRVLAPGSQDAVRAGAIRSSFYRRRSVELSLADAFLLAAPDQSDSIATKDPVVLAVATDLGITTVPVA